MTEETGQKNLQYNTHKTKDQVTQTPLKTGGNSGAPEGEAVPSPLVALVVIIPYHPVSSVSAMFSMSKLYR
jgi:ABC-type Na+ efflux pump permease subunit